MSERQRLKIQRGREQAQAATKQFVGSIEHPCVVGTAAERAGEVAYIHLSEGDPEMTIRTAMRRFMVERPRAVVLIFPHKTFTLPIERLHALAQEYFLEAFLGVAETYQQPGVSREQLRKEIEEDYGKKLRDPNCPVIPHIFHPNHGALVSTFMGPYERPHPRYAPHAMIVFTWSNDLQDVQRTQPALVEGIRKRAFAAMGSEYDGQVLIAEKPPRS